MGTKLAAVAVGLAAVWAVACSDDGGPASVPDQGAAKKDGAAAVDGPVPDRALEADAAGSKPDGKGGKIDAAATKPDAAGTKQLTFVQQVIDPSPQKPAFITAADLDGDGKPELVVSAFAASSPLGNGLVNRYSPKGGAGGWSKTALLAQSAGVKFPNRVSAADVDGDKDLDLILPYGFLACVPLSCGGLAWLEQTKAGFKRHDVVKNGHPLFFHHAELADVTGDGVKDLVTVGEAKPLLGAAKAEARIYPGDPKLAARFKSTPIKVGAGLGSFPTVVDLDGDNDLDIVSAQYFVKGESAAWMERTATGWTKRIIDKLSGPSIQLSLVPGLLGKGKASWVLANHTNTKDSAAAPESAVYLLTPGKDPRQPWARKKLSAGFMSRKSPMFGPQGAPGVFSWGDLDGDKDLDLLVSGDGDPNIYWLEQRPGGAFATHVLAKDLPQSGVAAADLDGDGKAEAIVGSYEKNKLLLFRAVYK